AGGRPRSGNAGRPARARRRLRRQPASPNNLTNQVGSLSVGLLDYSSGQALTISGGIMAVQGPIPVEFAQVFPRGLFAAGTFEPVRDFDASKAGGRFVQSKDKASGLPLWQVDAIDADPAARDKTVRVKVAATDQPVL